MAPHGVIVTASETMIGVELVALVHESFMLSEEPENRLAGTPIEPSFPCPKMV